jgi:hypothetical protein
MDISANREGLRFLGASRFFYSELKPLSHNFRVFDSTKVAAMNLAAQIKSMRFGFHRIPLLRQKIIPSFLQLETAICSSFQQS